MRLKAKTAQHGGLREIRGSERSTPMIHDDRQHRNITEFLSALYGNQESGAE